MLLYIIIILATLLISIVACVASNILAKMKPLEQLKEDEFYNRILQTLNRWILSEIIWTTVHIFLSVMPFICTVMILHVECYNTQLEDAIVLFSIISLSLMSVSYFLKPSVQAQVFRKAYEILKPAVIEYESWSNTEAGKTTKAMQDALEAGEKIIGTTIN